MVHAMNYESGNDKVRNILQYSNETIFLPNRIYINAMEEKSTKNDTLFMKNLNEVNNYLLLRNYYFFSTLDFLDLNGNCPLFCRNITVKAETH